MKISTTVTLFILIQNVIGRSSGQPSTTSTPSTTLTTTITTTSTTATSTTTTTPEPTTPTDYCKNTSTCQNGGTCLNGTNRFTCECIDGFTGAKCETNINECEHSPCKHNATCNNLLNGYSCTCPPGYSETNCETDIDECDSSPCQNGANCTDEVNGYTCTCLQGYAGPQCETGLLNVEITGGPYIVEEGTSVITLRCNISGSSKLLSVQWFKNKLELSKLINVHDSKDKYSGSTTSKPSLSIHQISKSKDKANYICSAENIAGWKNSSSVLLNVTDILPPKPIHLQNISTIGFTIHIDQASFPLFNIKLNDTKKTNICTNLTDTKIDNLTPGTCYSIEVSTVVRDQFSKPVIQNICLSPAPPNSISRKKQTNDSLTFNIVHGKGKIDHFDIFINGIYNSSTTQDQKGTDDTTAVIHDLVPGTLYDQISVMTDTNGLKSSLVMMKPYATYPDPPADIEVIEPTDKCCISLNIAEGFGRTESFYVYVNDTRKITFIVSNTNYTTGNITDLLPGRFYQIQVAAFSNELESVKKSISAVTKPNAPQIKISTNSTTTKQIFGTISQTDGGSDKFELFCAENPNLNFSINHSNFIINDLEPGHRYQIQATATFHNHISDKSELIPVCTIPHKPAVTVDKIHTNTSMIHGTISQTIGGNDSFTLYVDDKKYSEYTITKSSYVIRGLNPGEKYKIQATTTFCSLESVKTDPVEECTVPHKPEITVDKTHTSTTMIQGTILQTIGGNDSFTLYVDYVKYSKYTITKSSFVIRDLNPGQNYKIQATTMFCSLESVKTDPVEECTVPTAPELVGNVSTATTTTLSGCILQENSERYKFNLYCNETKELHYNITGSDYKISSLEPGHRYHLQATISLCSHSSEQSKPIEACTVPYQPMFQIDSNSTTTKSISGTIHQIKGGNDNFTLYCGGQTKLNYTIQGDKYSINDLEPGERYSCQATSAFCKHTSARTNLIEECTVPYPPNFEINSKSTTTTSILGTIRQTKGGNDNFTLYCEGHKLSYTIDGDKYRINNLEPGQRYRCQASSTFCHHTSTRTSLIEECTVPYPPSFEIDNKTTTKSISGTIHNIKGGYDNFTLYCEGQTKLNYTIQGDKYRIHDLEAGERYRCQASSTFCQHTSTRTNLIEECTVPTKPTFDVIKSTNEKMELNITKGNGVVEEYIVTMTPVDVDQCSTYQPIETKTLSYSTNKAQETVVNIQSLNPGTLYNISITSVSNGRHSLPHYLQHATDASPPLSVATDINKDSITFTITKGGGCVKYFIISIDGREYNVTALKDKEMTRYTVNNLDPSTTYKVTISVVSKGAETSQRQISFKTKNDPVPVIGGVIGAVLALLVIGIFVVSWRRQAMCFRKNQSTEVLDGKTNIGFEEEVEMADNRKKRPVKLTDFPRHVEYLSRNTNMGFAAEFKEFGVLSPKHSTNAAQLQENRPKNRYTNILPFDSSIVKLVGADDEPGSDFINANFIPGKRSPREYIAAQGPLPATKEDMWSMIWEQNASIVVMLTQIVERGRKKCEIYWPENLNEKMFLGDIIVEVETLSHLPDYVLRTIVLRLGDVEKRLRHYNYIAWPDMGTPATTDNMISFVDTVRKDIRPDMKGPIVVHCSAGVGRTGTFIVMDILLQEMRSQCKEVDIFGTILNLRNNRVNMVQTEDQYIFIHNCVRDFIEASDDEEEEVVDDEQCNEPIYQNV